MRNYEERDRVEWNHRIETIEKKEKEKGNTWRPRRQKAGLPLFLVFSYPIYRIALLERPSLLKERQLYLRPSRGRTSR